MYHAIAVYRPVSSRLGEAEVVTLYRGPCRDLAMASVEQSPDRTTYLCVMRADGKKLYEATGATRAGDASPLNALP